MTDLDEHKLKILQDFEKSFDSFMTDDRKFELVKRPLFIFLFSGQRRRSQLSLL
jgi:hypothetical protein